MNQSETHNATCASLCTDYNSEAGAEGCDTPHACWCPVGDLSYAEYSHAEHERLSKQAETAHWQAESYLARARAELMPGVGLELCETALNHILDTLRPTEGE